MGYRVAGAGSRFEGSTRHSMVFRDCPPLPVGWRNGGGAEQGEMRLWGWGGDRWKSEKNESSSSEVCM